MTDERERLLAKMAKAMAPVLFGNPDSEVGPATLYERNKLRDYASAALSVIEQSGGYAPAGKSRTDEVQYWFRRHLDLMKAIKKWPELPAPIVLKSLHECAEFSVDWSRGKHMQGELGLDAIPPVTECECGAGLWDRITKGEWRAMRKAVKEG